MTIKTVNINRGLNYNSITIAMLLSQFIGSTVVVLPSVIDRVVYGDLFYMRPTSLLALILHVLGSAMSIIEYFVSGALRARKNSKFATLNSSASVEKIVDHWARDAAMIDKNRAKLLGVMEHLDGARHIFYDAYKLTIEHTNIVSILIFSVSDICGLLRRLFHNSIIQLSWSRRHIDYVVSLIAISMIILAIMLHGLRIAYARHCTMILQQTTLLSACAEVLLQNKIDDRSLARRNVIGTLQSLYRAITGHDPDISILESHESYTVLRSICAALSALERISISGALRHRSLTLKYQQRLALWGACCEVATIIYYVVLYRISTIANSVSSIESIICGVQKAKICAIVAIVVSLVWASFQICRSYILNRLQDPGCRYRHYNIIKFLSLLPERVQLVDSWHHILEGEMDIWPVPESVGMFLDNRWHDSLPVKRRLDMAVYLIELKTEINNIGVRMLLHAVRHFLGCALATTNIIMIGSHTNSVAIASIACSLLCCIVSTIATFLAIYFCNKHRKTYYERAVAYELMSVAHDNENMEQLSTKYLQWNYIGSVIVAWLNDNDLVDKLRTDYDGMSLFDKLAMHRASVALGHNVITTSMAIFQDMGPILFVTLDSAMYGLAYADQSHGLMMRCLAVATFAILVVVLFVQSVAIYCGFRARADEAIDAVTASVGCAISATALEAATRSTTGMQC